MKSIKIVLMVLACLLVFSGCSENWNARFPDESLDIGAGSLTATDVTVEDDLTVTDDATIGGNAAVTGSISGAAISGTTGTFSSTLSGFFPAEHNTADTTMTTANVIPGSQISLTSTTIKRSFALPAAAAGLEYDLWAKESDSLRVTTASGDTILSLFGGKYKTIGSVAGYAKIRALDGTYWALVDSLGDWACY